MTGEKKSPSCMGLSSVRLPCGRKRGRAKKSEEGVLAPHSVMAGCTLLAEILSMEVGEKGLGEDVGLSPVRNFL